MYAPELCPRSRHVARSDSPYAGGSDPGGKPLGRWCLGGIARDLPANLFGVAEGGEDLFR